MIETKIFAIFDRELKKDFAPELSVDLNNKEVELLLLVNKYPSESMGFYGREIGLEKGSFTYLSDLLIQKKLIVQTENPIDSRSKLLELSEIGVMISNTIRMQLDSYISERLKIFSDFEVHQLIFAIEAIKNLYEKFQQSHLMENE
ncbi:MAG: hypothetical protein JW908_10775 [Anaerolineales bacterium]|nr:hypothetical protein [Anaerolineales bacterium]